MTIVPFELYHGWVFFPAEVDGRRGRLILDTGEPVIHLNREYVKPNGTGGLDTVTEAIPGHFQAPYNVRILQIGTVRESLKAGNAGPPQPMYPSNANIETYFKFGQFDDNGHPVIGFMGLSAMEPFETIIDYPNQQLILIKLDSAGRRLVDVPAFTPTMTTPLAPVSNSSGAHWWGVVARMGNEVDTLEIDTGGPCSNLLDATRQKFATHLAPAGQCADLNGEQLLAFDHIVVGGRTLDAVPFAVDIDDSNDLNYPFLRQLGVVGFNLRTRQFMVYH